MTRFVAIPVGQGDAFYLEREGLSVLVDGGRSRHGFGSMFAACLGRNELDVIVCTHNDADHANGIIGFLSAGLRCREVWLPGRWLRVLPDVLKPSAKLLSELRKDVTPESVWDHAGESEDSDPKTLLESYAESLPPLVASDEDGVRLGDDGWPHSCRSSLETVPDGSLLGQLRLPRAVDFLHALTDLPAWLDGRHDALLASAIAAADRIRQIARLAYHAGVRVRWFEFTDAQPAGGNIGQFEPLNAQEVIHVKSRSGRLLESLALTESNRESLVFWAPPASGHRGALFTADSDLAAITLPDSLTGAIITAPHHGSEANVKAYVAIQHAANATAEKIVWVRSDGKYRSRPGRSFLNISPKQRHCTLCRSSDSKDAVRFDVDHGAWSPNPARACSCK